MHRNSESPTAPIDCPICGPVSKTLFGHCHDLPIVTCDHCGLLFVGEYQSIQSTLDFFRDEHVRSEGVTHEHYVDLRKHSLQREAAIIQKLLPAGGRLVDVGTASGFFLQNFKGKSTWQVEGVEPSKASTRYARKTFGLTVHEGFLPDQQFDGESFDVVTSLDSFTCHRQPREDMHEFFRILKPGGILAIEVGGLRFRRLTGSGLLCRLAFGKPLRLNAGINFFYYGRSTLTRLAELAGFRLESSYPEAMPEIGGPVTRLARLVYFHSSAALYRLTAGHWNIAPKEFFIFRKPLLAVGMCNTEHPRAAKAA